MDDKGKDTETATLYQDGDTRYERQDDDRGEATESMNDAKHTVHSTSESDSETILEQVHESSRFSEGVLQSEEQSQEPVAASQPNHDANEVDNGDWGFSSIWGGGKKKKHKSAPSPPPKSKPLFSELSEMVSAVQEPDAVEEPKSEDENNRGTKPPWYKKKTSTTQAPGEDDTWADRVPPPAKIVRPDEVDPWGSAAFNISKKTQKSVVEEEPPPPPLGLEAAPKSDPVPEPEPEKMEEEDPWAFTFGATKDKKKKKKKRKKRALIPNLTSPPPEVEPELPPMKEMEAPPTADENIMVARIVEEEAEAARIAAEKEVYKRTGVEEVTDVLGPEDSRSFTSGTVTPPRRRRRSQQPRGNARRRPEDGGERREPQSNPISQAPPDPGRTGYYNNSALTPYFDQFQNPSALPNYWPYGSPPQQNPSHLRDLRDPGYYSIPQESDPSRNKIGSPTTNPPPLNHDGLARSQHYEPVSPVLTAGTIRSNRPTQQRTTHSEALGSTATDHDETRESLVEGLLQPPGSERQSIQSDGLAFSVSVQCSHATLHSRFSTLLHQYWPERTAHNDFGSVWVKKAVSSKRFKQRDGLHSIELVCHTGPTPTDTEDYQIQWLHMQRHGMDLADFEDMCLNAPNITGELKYVVLNLFKKVRDTARKRFRENYYVTPGTVLRCDGATSRSVGDHDLSATFLCFPYLALGAPNDLHRQNSDYPTRSMLQVLYPYETTSVHETPPSFCKDTQHASDHLLYVPQLWTVIVGSKYVITCADLGSTEVLGTSVTVVQSEIPMELPTLVHDWLPDKYADIRVEEFLEEEYNDSDEYVRLFDGKRIEEFLVDDDEWSIEETTRIPTRDATAHDLPTIDESQPQLQSRLQYRSPTADAEDQKEGVSSLESMVDDDADEPASRDKNVGETPRLANQPESLQSLPKQSEEKDSLLSMLQCLEHPRMDAGYLESYGTVVSYVLHVWPKPPHNGKSEHMEALTSLEQSLHRAETLRRLCNTGWSQAGSDPFPSAGGNVVEGHNTDQSMVDEELRNLDEVVQCAITLLQEALKSTHGTPGSTPISAYEETAIKQSHIDEIEPPKSNLVQKSTPPFLTWAWLSSGFEQSIPAPRVAAENLFTIMQDIDRHLCRSKEDSYTNSSKTTLADLEHQMTQQKATNELSTSYTFLPRVPLGLRTLAEPPSPLNNAHVAEVTDDAILQSQKYAIVKVVNEIATTAQSFVGLFIPCSYQHPVSQKIWGSLSDLLKDAASIVNDRTERARSSFLIRPLEKAFMKEHKIEDPPQPLQNCVACREGYVYKTAQEASEHLRGHFGGRDNLLMIAHMRWARRYWVRTEDQVRKELFNKHQLRLLQICLNYLKVLYNRADKIHQGISLEDQGDLAKYQLPNDLVDCFEATALFIMQSAMSLKTTKNEMNSWQHVPGIAFEELQTPAIEAALERLGELGQSAQTSMTRAEKILALSDPETSMMSMGVAGPELLVAVILHNLQKRPLLQDVDMDVNQLYQEYTSKLQYQINQFPRKRQLRDIHALQEELSVVQSVNSWQQQSFERFRRILNPKSFSNPIPQLRIAMFPSEAECLGAGLKSLQSQATELDALEKRTHYLRSQLKQSVEILEADHGKAILVFTMITTIFLPLSFVTSFFGMNTADIRNMDRGQGYFWAIAVPVTAGIVFAAVLLAYHGDKLYDAILQAIHQFTEHQSNSPAMVLRPERKRSWGQGLATHRRPWKTRR